MGIPAVSGLISGAQSALDPAGPQAGAIATLSWIMFVGSGVIFLIVMVMLALAFMAPARWRMWIGSRHVVVFGGIAFPIVVLSALLVYGLVLARDIVADPGREALQVNVVGEQFWWRVRYPSSEEGALETANELHIPAGRPVRVVLTTADVIHSVGIPNIAGKLDMIPGQANTLTFQAERPGIYRAQCAEFCGAAHALMAFDVVVHPEQEFAAWLRAQQRPAQEPIVPFEQQGRELFLASGCGACHAVRGSPAVGRLGPDLTHVGSRRTIAAGSFPNNKGTLAGWIADSQHLKPNNKMPSFDVFTGEQLRSIAAYLASLK